MTEEKKEVLQSYLARAIDLASFIEYATGSVISKTLLDKKSGTLTLFSFDAGQGLSEHTSPYDAVVQILDGEADVRVGEKHIRVTAGQLVIMPANVPHALRAIQRFKMLLILVR